MRTTRDLTAVIENGKLGAFQRGILAICFLIVVMDGFDTQAIGFAAQSIAQARGIPIASFGAVFSAGLLGAVIGAFAMGPISDLHGRRRPLALLILVFALASLALTLATTLPAIIVLRVIAGIGLGGAIPSLIALATEYSPARLRGTLTGVLYAGFPLGGAIGAVISAKVMPAFGWESLFIIGGVGPLLLSLVVVAFLPESVRFLERHGRQKSLEAIADRIAPGSRNTGLEVVVDTRDAVVRAPVRQLFKGGRTASTLLLWTAFFACFVMLIVLVLWTPALMKAVGFGVGAAAIIAGFVNLGSVFGTAAGGRLVDRFGVLPTVPILFALGGLAIAALGRSGGAFWIAGSMAAASGLFVGAGSAALLALAVREYPAAIRGTGVGWAMGVGRLGQVTGPITIGWLLGLGVSVSGLFLLTAVPAACALVAVTFFGLLAKRERHDGPFDEDAIEALAAAAVSVRHTDR